MSGDRDSRCEYDPADLSEDVDLPLDLRKEILHLHAQLATCTHWQVLGIEWDAPPSAVRAAYVERVKRFHPDRYAGRKIGSYLRRIEEIFRALTVARDELTDESRRAAYVEATAPRDVEARSETRRAIDDARARERRDRLARSNPMVARVTRGKELLERGKQAMQEGKFTKAANDFLTVAGLDPQNAEARALAEEARRHAAAERAQEMYEAALSAEAVGAAARALAIARQAIEANPRDARYSTAGSRMALACGNHAEARALAEQAVRYAPRDARALEALGIALHALGNGRQARRALEEALSIDPGLATARELAKRLRWSFLG